VRGAFWVTWLSQVHSTLVVTTMLSDASSVNGADQEHIRGFEVDLARCELWIGTVRFTSQEHKYRQERILRNGYTLLLFREWWNMSHFHRNFHLDFLWKHKNDCVYDIVFVSNNLSHMEW